MGNDSKHILMLPIMAQGHLIPFLQLAKKIQQTKTTSNFTITILSTPININYLRSVLSEHDDDIDHNNHGKEIYSTSNSSIHLVELPFCSTDHGLPPDAENTQFLTVTQIIKLFHASAALEAPVRRFISEEIVAKEGCPPACIINDVFVGWGVEVAKSFGSLPITFSTTGFYGTAAYISLWNELPHRHCKQDQDEYTLPCFPDNHRFLRSHLHPLLKDADGTDEWSRFFQPQMRMSMSSAGWICNAVEEMEPLGMSILTKYLNLPVWAIGPMLPQSLLSVARPVSPLTRFELGNDCGIYSKDLKEFLISQASDSVLYISFGSQNTITPTQMMELAMGLEESNESFIWVIRPPIGFNAQGEFKDEWLPEGFRNRVMESGKGLLLQKWAPQREILSHESTGAFLSHCGWNSVMESLSQGVPIIGWPLAAEQSFNLKMLEEEMEVAVELTRGLQGIINKEKVQRVIKLVLDKEEGRGREMKKKAVEVSKQLKGAVREEGGQKGSSLRAMDDFVQTIFLN